MGDGATPGRPSLLLPTGWECAHIYAGAVCANVNALGVHICAQALHSPMGVHVCVHLLGHSFASVPVCVYLCMHEFKDLAIQSAGVSPAHFPHKQALAWKYSL